MLDSPPLTRQTRAVAPPVPPRDLDSAQATALPGYIGQVAGVVEQNELRLELGIRDSDETDAEVRIPAPFRGRTGIEKDRATFTFDERLVAMPEDNQVDVSSCGGQGRFQRRLAVVSVQQKQGAGTRLDPNAVRKRLDQVERVGVTTHRHNRSHLFHPVQHRGVTGVAGVQDQTNCHPAKELNDRLHRTSGPGRADVRVTKDPEENRRWGPNPAFGNRQLSRPKAPAHIIPSGVLIRPTIGTIPVFREFNGVLS